ncbi:hypothetical protein [Pontibacter pamirensis]|nr:hypothetical protein [Pontibacter pamirensis]
MKVKWHLQCHFTNSTSVNKGLDAKNGQPISGPGSFIFDCTLNQDIE